MDEGTAPRTWRFALELERIREGDTEALGRLVADAWAPLVRYLEGLTESSEAAQDAAQEALVRLWTHRERWGGGSARAILFRIGRNVALDQGRRAEVRRRFFRREGPVLADLRPPTPSDELRRSEARTRIDEAIASLPPRRREVFGLVRLEGFSYREAADALGVSPQTVANQMSLALRDLRDLLADLAPEAAHGTDAPSDRRSHDG
ncbi:MAG: sigma-70 family RNA polymerase sigma factor [Longimicrobiales bacterium]